LPKLNSVANLPRICHHEILKHMNKLQIKEKHPEKAIGFFHLRQPYF